MYNEAGDQENWLNVQYVEPSHCNLCGNLNGTGNLANCTLPGELTGEFTVIFMSVPFPV